MTYFLPEILRGHIYHVNDDLEAAQHELELDELWLDGDDWIEAA